MQIVDLPLYAIAILVFVGLIFTLWSYFGRTCALCGGRLRLEQQSDSLGFNLSKRITFSLWKGPRRYSETWKCKKCGNETTHRFWSLE